MTVCRPFMGQSRENGLEALVTIMEHLLKLMAVLQRLWRRRL